MRRVDLAVPVCVARHLGTPVLVVVFVEVFGLIHARIVAVLDAVVVFVTERIDVAAAVLVPVAVIQPRAAASGAGAMRQATPIMAAAAAARRSREWTRG